MSTPLCTTLNPNVPPVIVGAGPAGIRAAQTLVAQGLRPILIDEAARGGGQIYRQPPPGFSRPPEALYGFEAARARAVHDTWLTLLPQLDYRPDHLVWNAGPGWLDVLHGDQTQRLAWSQVIVATGATDRVLPLPGWTLPGVYTLGGAQVALKYQGCSIGRRVLLTGTGPLLYLVAYQIAKAGRAHGVQVAGVLDTAGWGGKIAALPALLTQPATLGKGQYFLAWLRAHGVPVHWGVQPLRVLGQERVEGLLWRDRQGREHRTEADGLALGYALRSETQLADLLDCRFEFDALNRAHLPVRDPAGRSSVPGVYLAGDGAGIQGADAAEWAGERAALALLEDRQGHRPGPRGQLLEARLARIGRFRQGLEQAFPFPVRWAAQAPDELVVCRCENITAGELRQQVKDSGAPELNRLKALSRVGMGRCQGRMCGVAAAEILAHASGLPIDQVGRLRAQAPIKPLPLMAQAAQADPANAAETD
ncbi:MAG: NAD(P)/FAD-dependent oxidoreductase [Curvibacter sp.]|nr:MAG: NAD(P)/FAD-dependent oxidoreductase [Curvibacter sp.]